MVLAVAVVLLLVFSALAFRFGSPPTGPTLPTQVSGLTFSEANRLTNASVTNVSGGPWRLVSVVGVVTTQPVALPVDTLPPTACQDLPGPSLWNGSRIPVWSGPLDAGIAPFWEFLYVNSSGGFLPVQTVNESVAEQGPIASNSPCGSALAAIDPNRSYSHSPTVVAPMDSPVAARIAWNNGASQFLATQHQTALFMGLGGPPPLYGIPWGGGWGLYYSTCGLNGVSGNAAEADFGISNDTGPWVILTGNATCTYRNNSISFGPPTKSAAPEGGTFYSFQLSVNSLFLESWMMSLALANVTGSTLSAAKVSCANSSFGPNSCLPDGPGWFAALSTDKGYWVDLFGNQTSSGGWDLPNVGIYTNDTLVVYLPASLAASSQTLSTLSTVSSIQLTGSIVF